MTIEEFREKYRYTLGGMALEGLAVDGPEPTSASGPLGRTVRMFRIPQLIEKLLGDMYADLVTIPALQKDAALKPPTAPSPPPAVVPQQRSAVGGQQMPAGARR